MPKLDPDKALGSIVGLAVCEALSASNTTIISKTDPLPNPCWGDGTSMALSLAESLAESQGMDQRDQMIRYTSWFRYGYLSSTETCDFIDPVVKQATLRFERNWVPEDSDHTEGDACLARVAPTVIYFSDTRDHAVEAVAQTTRTTHAGAQSVNACRVLAGMIFDALHRVDAKKNLTPHLPADMCLEMGMLFGDNPHPLSCAACTSLQGAISAFRHGKTFAEGCQLCMPHGPRAMAAYGQLAGAWYGLQDIPQAWQNSVAKFDLLTRMTTHLLKD